MEANGLPEVIPHRLARPLGAGPRQESRGRPSAPSEGGALGELNMWGWGGTTGNFNKRQCKKCKATQKECRKKIPTKICPGLQWPSTTGNQS